MNNDKITNIGLLLVFAVLVVFALLPASQGTEDRPDGETQKSAAVPEEEVIPEPGTHSALPLKGVDHEFLPLVLGSRWTYDVHGPKKLVPENTWTMQIVTAPKGDNPGEVLVGFGKDRSSAHVWSDGISLRMDFLPLIEPVEFLGDDNQRHPKRIGIRLRQVHDIRAKVTAWCFGR